MAFFEKIFRKQEQPKPPQQELDPRKAKFQELIGKATSFDVLYKLIDVYMKEGKEELKATIKSAVSSGRTYLVPDMMGLRKKTEELLKIIGQRRLQATLEKRKERHKAFEEKEQREYQEMMEKKYGIKSEDKKTAA